LQLLNNKNEFHSINNETAYLSFFTKDINKIIKKLKKYEITIERNENYITIFYNDKNICDIYDSSDLCISFCKKKDFNVLSIFGIKYFIYNNLISKINNIEISKYMISNINKYITNTNCKDNCKLNLECYGDGKPPGWQIIKSRWDNGIVKYKPSLKKQLDTYFNK